MPTQRSFTAAHDINQWRTDMKTLITLAVIASTAVGSAAWAQTMQPSTPAGRDMNSMPGQTSNPNTNLPATSSNATAAEAAAKAQIEAKGYNGIKSLTRDTAGNWTGKAMRNNVEVAVTLDTKGNIREQ
jgi:hypothetical protein